MAVLGKSWCRCQPDAGCGQDPDVPCTDDHSQCVPRQAWREKGCQLHKIMEGSKSPLRSSCPAIPSALPWAPANHVPRCHIRTGTVTAPGQSVQCLITSRWRNCSWHRGCWRLLPSCHLPTAGGAAGCGRAASPPPSSPWVWRLTLGSWMAACMKPSVPFSVLLKPACGFYERR